MHSITFAALLGTLAAQPSTAHSAATSGQVTTEHYYRIKWGSADEFLRLYKANHQPLLDEMKRQGRIVAVRSETPFTHMAGGTRWDYRVTITYADAASAVVVGGAFDEAFEAAEKKLYPDRKKFEAEEARRFSLLEDHWDVIVTPAGD